MKTVHHIETIGEFNSLSNQPHSHSLISVVDFSNYVKKDTVRPHAISFGFYAVFLKQNEHCEIRYGRKNYDYQEGTLLFISPNQVISIEEDGEDYIPGGYALLFHPLLIEKTPLGRQINNYNFFSYDVNEALHISETERHSIVECLSKIKDELDTTDDKHSNKLIITNLDLFLSYSLRFYDRQFETRESVNNSIIQKFGVLLDAYFITGKAKELGTPTVAYFAEKLNLSPNYFGDLIKKHTKLSPQEHIQLKQIEIAKEKIFDHDMPVNQIAYELGFSYSQHFSRFFKQQVGYTPLQYRKTGAIKKI